MLFGSTCTLSLVINLPQYRIMVANNTLAGLQLQSVLLTLPEKEIESCEQVFFSLSMKKKVIQPYSDVALDFVHHDDEERLQMLRSVFRSM
jgi:hypothetical protein